MTCVTQQPRPGFFFCVGFATNVAGDFGVGPHRGTMHKIFEAMGAEFQALGFEGGHIGGEKWRLRHRRSLLMLACCVKRASVDSFEERTSEFNEKMGCTRQKQARS